MHALFSGKWRLLGLYLWVPGMITPPVFDALLLPSSPFLPARHPLYHLSHSPSCFVTLRVYFRFFLCSPSPPPPPPSPSLLEFFVALLVTFVEGLGVFPPTFDNLGVFWEFLFLGEVFESASTIIFRLFFFEFVFLGLFPTLPSWRRVLIWLREKERETCGKSTPVKNSNNSINLKW